MTLDNAVADIEAWVFDLDNTLYSANASIYPAIGVRMTAYIAQALKCDEAQALELRERYFHLYGATVLGLVKHHEIDAADFLDDVHKVDLSEIAADAELASLIAALPGRKVIFTNGVEAYAREIAGRLGIEAHIDDIVALDPDALKPKPDPAAFRRLIARTHIYAQASILFDDHPQNLQAAHEFGFKTVLIGDAPKPNFVDCAARDVKSALRALLTRDFPSPPRGGEDGA
jgi:putative hydrolase of the HAD superfamily